MVFPVIAIDGPAASGKGTLAKRLALELGYDHLDTGLLYRAVAKKIIDAGASPDDVAVASEMAKALTLSDLSASGLRGEAMGKAASICSCIPEVRQALLDYQVGFAANPPSGKGAVLDGRDIGTAVCPHAPLKIWMTASAATRAMRRQAEDPQGPVLAQILSAIEERDERERTRSVSPMIPAADALTIDTSELSAQDAFALAKGWAQALPPARKSGIKP
jgi:cytidylate kinase